jgi:hypothetical protein
MGWTETVSRYHDRLGAAVTAHRGQELKTAQVQEIYAAAYPDASELQWVMPSYHAFNHPDCKEPCTCAGTHRAIFDRVRYGVWRVR